MNGFSRSIVAAAAVVVVASVAARAGDERPPSKEELAAERARELHAAGDTAALRAMAAPTKYVDDPWLVLDELCATGDIDAATGLADVFPERDREAAQRYVLARTEHPRDPERAATWRLGNALRKARRHAEALELLESIAPDPAVDAEQGGLLAARTLVDTGICLVHLRRPAEALPHFELLESRARDLGWTLGVMLALDMRGLAASRIPDAEAARAPWQRALTMHRELNDPAGESWLLSQMGNLERRTGRLNHAEELQHRAVELAAGSGAALQHGTALGNLGVLELRRGDLAAALNAFQDAVDVLARSEHWLPLARAVSRLAFALEQVGDASQAVHALDTGMHALEAGDGATAARVDLAIRRAGIALRWQLPGAAPEALAAAADEAAELGAHELAAEAFGQLGDAYARGGAFDDAQQSYDRAAALAERAGSERLVALASFTSALLDVRRGNAGAAAARAAEHEPRWRGISPPLAVDALRARIAYARGKWAEAHDHALAHLRSVAETGRGLAASERQWVGWSGRDAPGLAVGAAVALADPRRLSAAMETARAAAFVERAGGRDAVRSAALPRALLERRARAEADLDEARRALTAARAEGLLNAVDAATARVGAARDELNAIDVRIARRQQVFQRSNSVATATPDALRAALGDGGAFVSIDVAAVRPGIDGDADRMVALVVTGGGDRIVELGDAVAIRAATVDVLADPTAERLDALRGLLVAPLKLAEDTRRVVVSAPDTLGQVPFGGLLPGRAVAAVPSGTAWLRLRERDVPGDGRVLAIGDPALEKAPSGPDPSWGPVASRGGLDGIGPLPAARDEARAVGDDVLIGGDATETAVRAHLAGKAPWRAVHLACHGLVEAGHPTLGALVLTRDDRNDGLLTAREIVDLEIDSRLVVLSACGSARGEAHGREGLDGLTRAFLLAGCPRVIGSLWKVDDRATRALMERFYEEWREKDASPAEALARATAALRENPRFADPRHWAGWVLWGRLD